MNKSLQDWLQEGSDLYDLAVNEYHQMEIQLADLQEQMLAKRIEINEVAKIVGKSPLTPSNMEPATNESPTTTTAATEQPVEVDVEVVDLGKSAPYTLNSIARALTGKPTRR